MEFSKKMQGTNLNDVACCPNGYKLVVGNNHIDLTKTVNNNQCGAGNSKFTKYVGGGYSVYRTSDGWVLKQKNDENGENWIKHDGGEDCCPRDRGMITFKSPECTLTNENRDCSDGKTCCSWPQGIDAEIHCK